MYLAIWNIRGLIGPVKQAEIRNLIRVNRLCCVGILEMKASPAQFPSISSGLVPGWIWIANYEHSDKGRIWIGWNLMLADFTSLSFSPQAIHGHLRCLSTGDSFYFSVVYAEHTFVHRHPLWQDLIRTSSSRISVPWLVAGDFNAIRFPSDRIGSLSTWLPSYDEFGNCLQQAELEDLRYTGCRFLWATSSGENRK